MKSSIHSKQTTSLSLLSLMLVCFALLPNAQAVSPPPDGGYPGANTAEGMDALFSLTSGIANTAVGFNALHNNTTGGFNVAVGSSALTNNTTGNFNMAIGTDALRDNNSNFNLAIGFRVGFMNTTGNHLTGIGAAAMRNNTTGSLNTAIGSDALRQNSTGENNTAIGASALTNNTADNNAAVGAGALEFNTSGTQNCAFGSFAMLDNDTGFDNTAVGFQAMQNSAGGNVLFNTAVGISALMNTSANANVAVGDFALESDSSGNFNTAIGAVAGFNQTTGSGNVYIGQGIEGVAGEDDHTYIKNINSTSVSGSGADFVTVDLTTGLLGHLSSSRRYKEDVKPMDNASETLYRLKPVTYRYKKEIDATQLPAFGLIAEDVAEVNPNLVARNAQGEIESVHYEMVNAMLLNEFLKEHKKVEEQQTNIAELKNEVQTMMAQLKQQAAQIQRVSARFEVNNPAPQIVVNKP